MSCYVIVVLLHYLNLLQEERRVSLRKYQVHDETMMVSEVPELYLTCEICFVVLSYLFSSR